MSLDLVGSFNVGCPMSHEELADQVVSAMFPERKRFTHSGGLDEALRNNDKREISKKRFEEALVRFKALISETPVMELEEDDPRCNLAKCLAFREPDTYFAYHTVLYSDSYSDYRGMRVITKNPDVVKQEKERFSEMGIEFDRHWYKNTEEREMQLAKWKS